MDKLKDHKHYAMYILLVIVIVWALSREKQGRYTLSSAGGAGGGAVYVLDTRTSQLWIRSPANFNMYLGTNENPKREKIEITKPQDVD